MNKLDAGLKSHNFDNSDTVIHSIEKDGEFKDNLLKLKITKNYGFMMELSGIMFIQ